MVKIMSLRDKFKLYLFELKLLLSNINYVTAVFSICTWRTQTEHLQRVKLNKNMGSEKG